MLLLGRSIVSRGDRGGRVALPLFERHDQVSAAEPGSHERRVEGLPQQRRQREEENAEVRVQ